ncbi:hypothetical protein HMPREF0322_05001 [Desulfitobacterium hafniense DP7]|uniref:Uncharacterized protein n=1 Tax=Desulfitobacterium hafniense DP7 TaxID=537010 RepID=G9XVI9_DESHA|nr:hypothetical protein HMPREF0322_05001 [Desulfitobacterium hafniense DP7]
MTYKKTPHFPTLLYHTEGYPAKPFTAFSAGPLNSVRQQIIAD